MLRFKRCLWVLGALLALAGCGGGSSGSETPPPAAAVGTVTGKAEVVSTGAPLAGVDVSAGSATTKTAADGSFSLAGVAPGTRVVIRAVLSGYAPNMATTEVTANQTSNVRFVLTPVGVSAVVAVSSGGVVSVPNSAAQVNLPANALVDFVTKAPVAGSVTVQVTPINPAADPAAMPGNYLAQAAAGGAPAPIESFGAIKVDIRDASGRRVDLAANQTATIRVPVASRSENVPATIPLYYFNEDTGLWVQEGSATLQGSGADRYYEGQVRHFTFWNCDQPLETIIVRGCVVDAANARIANVRVSSQGLDYIGSASVTTNAAGDFELPMRRNGVASVFGELNQRFTNVVRAGPSDTDIRLSECLRLGAAGVLQPPVIVSQPQSDTVTSGRVVFFTVQAVGSPTLRYQWRRNGQALAGQIFPTLAFAATLADNGAVYSVVVSNPAGSATSNDATLTVTSVSNVAPFITTQPAPQTVLVGQSATFSVEARGSPSPSYQWQRNGQNISGATSASYTTPALTTADNGAIYTVVVSNSVGTVTSTAALLTVNAVATAPSITGVATFTVVASGTSPLQYQWRRNGVAISGATAASYTTSTLALADNGASFDVVVSNSAGSVTSAAAVLTVTTNNTAQQEALVRLAFLAFDYLELATAGFVAVDDNDRFVGSSQACSDGGSLITLLNGAAAVVGNPLPEGSNTLASTFTNCRVDPSQTFNGSTSLQYNLTVGALSNGTATAAMTNMRRVVTEGGAGTRVVSDITGNGNVSATVSETANGAQVTSVVTFTPGAGATLRSAVSELTATAVSGSMTIRLVETALGNNDFRFDQSRFTSNNNTFTVGGRTYVSNGFIDISFANGAFTVSGEITVSENGTQIGRIFADAQGSYQIEVNGRIVPFENPLRAAARKPSRLK
jgi:Immunoglobulin I-set domain/Carboxypeptidase regulatory-like domain